MKPSTRLTPRVIGRNGIIVFRAMTCLALSIASARRAACTVLAATAIGVPGTATAGAENNGTAIRPFRVNVSEADLADLRRRIEATRWPDKETS